MEPDVPVSVSVEVPSGVPGLPLLPELLFPPQPTTSERRAMGQTGMRLPGIRHGIGGTAEAAVVLTVTLKGTGEFELTDTGFGGLHVAWAGAPEHVKPTVP